MLSNKNPKTETSVTASDLPQRAKGIKKKRALLVIVLISAIIAGIFVWRQSHEEDKGRQRVSGRIEGYETNVGAKIAGRVDYIAVREGDMVQRGEIIVRLSDEDIQAQRRGARARVSKAEEQFNEANDQLAIVQSQIDEAELNQQQSRGDATGRIYQAEANVMSAKAQVSQAQAQLAESVANRKLAAIRKQRYDELTKERAVSQDQDDQAQANLETAAADVVAKEAGVSAAKKQLHATEGALTTAETMRFNPPIRGAQKSTLEKQLVQAQSQLRAARHDIGDAKAAVEQITANIAYLNIQSPITGVVTARPVEPGAVVAAGQTVLSLINLDTVYLRAYVPEGRVGKVRVGQRALIYLDSDPKKGLEGQVIEIDPEASFTPENIYFKDDRVKQVFGIKIGIKDPQRFPKPGMPADADILLNQ